MWWEFVVFGVGAYLLGSIPSGLIVGRMARGIDIRDYGSGKTGFTNAVRTIGVKWGALVLVVDLAKGALPVALAIAVSDEPYVATVAGLAAVIGHDWPIYVGFRGGRGVATSFGALLAMNPIAAGALLPVGLALVAVTRIMSVMSVGMAPVAAVVFVVLSALGLQPWAYAVYAVIAAALLVALHRENLRRLLAGTEPKIGRGGERRAPEAGEAEGEQGLQAERPPQ
jgi:glycerol-3-phosphate acyltransferase PlsY